MWIFSRQPKSAQLEEYITEQSFDILYRPKVRKKCIIFFLVIGDSCEFLLPTGQLHFGYSLALLCQQDTYNCVCV